MAFTTFDENDTLATMVKMRRIALDLTQLELAKKLGYTISNFVGMIENGNAKFPREKVLQFADVLGVPRGVFVRAWLKQYQEDWVEIIEIKKEWLGD